MCYKKLLLLNDATNEHLVPSTTRSLHLPSNTQKRLHIKYSKHACLTLCLTPPQVLVGNKTMLYDAS